MIASRATFPQAERAAMAVSAPMHFRAQHFSSKDYEFQITLHVPNGGKSL